MDKTLTNPSYKVTDKMVLLTKGEYKGHKFAIIDFGKYPVAYVESKFTDIAIGDCDDERLMNITAHGGVTFYDRCYWDDSKDLYIGWDYGHYGDYIAMQGIDFDILRDNHKWTTPEILTDVVMVIEALAEKEG